MSAVCTSSHIQPGEELFGYLETPFWGGHPASLTSLGECWRVQPVLLNASALHPSSCCPQCHQTKSKPILGGLEYYSLSHLGGPLLLPHQKETLNLASEPCLFSSDHQSLTPICSPPCATPVGWAHCFGPGVRQNIKVGVSGRATPLVSWWPGSKRKRRGQRPQGKGLPNSLAWSWHSGCTLLARAQSSDPGPLGLPQPAGIA
jgi:hypothetical protein